MEKQRIIFHIDCNAFYASVEEILYPEYKKVPMAVCGDPASRRGIILAKNEMAKKYNIKTAETVYQAIKKCPDLVLRPARHSLYTEYSERVNALYEEYTDQVEPFGRDESYLDVTGSLHLFGGDSVKLAHEIRERIPREIGLTVSVGASYNKAFAKLASDMKKPNAVTVITPENYKDVVWPLPASALLMVGRHTEEILRRLQIHTIGELAHADRELLSKYLGKIGEYLYQNANGLDDTPVASVTGGHGIQSVGNGMTFKRDLTTMEDIRVAVIALSDTVAVRLRRYGQKCATLQVTIKDKEFKVITRQKPLSNPTWLASDLVKNALEIIGQAWLAGKPIRMLTITGMKLLSPEEVQAQLSFFDDPQEILEQEKHEKLELTIDALRNKFGDQIIMPGSIMKNSLGIHEEYNKNKSAEME